MSGSALRALLLPLGIDQVSIDPIVGPAITAPAA
jgi:hypothetical protein